MQGARVGERPVERRGAPKVVGHSVGVLDRVRARGWKARPRRTLKSGQVCVGVLRTADVQEEEVAFRLAGERAPRDLKYARRAVEYRIDRTAATGSDEAHREGHRSRFDSPEHYGYASILNAYSPHGAAPDGHAYTLKDAGALFCCSESVTVTANVVSVPPAPSWAVQLALFPQYGDPSTVHA